MLSFIYITCRKDPKIEWFIDSLYNQVMEENFDLSKIQIVIVDYELQYDESRRELIKNIIGGRFEFIHVEPKPSLVQGKMKITKINYHSCSIPRNTGVCYAKYNYLLFIDDLGVLYPNSFKYMLEYAYKKLVVGFSYKKVYDLSVENGIIKNCREHDGGIDSRIKYFDKDFNKITGSSLFGYSASPLECLLKVNGYDEIHNTMGGEDYNYGIRLEKTGTPIYYSKKVLFYESEEWADQGNIFIRRDPLLSDEKYKNIMKKYKVVKRWDPNGRKDLSHLLLDLLTRNKYWTEGNDYNLKELREKIQNGGVFNTEFDKNMKLIDGVCVKDL